MFSGTTNNDAKTHKYIQGGPKNKPQTFVHIFAKYSPIFNFFSPAYSAENL